MESNLDNYRKDLSKLIKMGELMLKDMHLRGLEQDGKLDKTQKESQKKLEGIFEANYQKWYTESYSLIKQIIPDRLLEFELLYKSDTKRKEINAVNYTIQDWLVGIRSNVNKYTGEKNFNDLAAAIMRFNTQHEIVKSAELRFESSIFEIRKLLIADLFDSEIDSARELLKNRYLRPAGVIAGVVLEKHLSDVCINHNLTLRKKHPTISDYNDLLKDNKIIDVPIWRLIQRMADLRNLCGHKRNREPTNDEVTELIDGVDKLTKSLF